MGDVAQAALADRLGPRLAAATAFATTEHFNLQTARAVTVSEANGRAGIYLAALSSNLIALAFIGQMSRLGTAFYVFALILLPVLAFLGVVTFLRLVQSSIEDIAYAHRIGRLRDFYLRVAPELEPHLVVIRESGSAAPFGSAWQLTLTAAGMVAVVTSIVVAACAGLVLLAAGVHPLAIPVACGAVIGAGAFSLHERHHRRARRLQLRGCRPGRDLDPRNVRGDRMTRDQLVAALQRRPAVRRGDSRALVLQGRGWSAGRGS